MGWVSGLLAGCSTAWHKYHNYFWVDCLSHFSVSTSSDCSPLLLPHKRCKLRRQGGDTSRVWGKCIQQYETSVLRSLYFTAVSICVAKLHHLLIVLLKPTAFFFCISVRWADQNRFQRNILSYIYLLLIQFTMIEHKSFQGEMSVGNEQRLRRCNTNG